MRNTWFALGGIGLAALGFSACSSDGESGGSGGNGGSAATAGSGATAGSAGSAQGGSGAQGGSAGSAQGGSGAGGASGGTGGASGGTGGGSSYIPTEMGLRVAFFGDQSLSQDAKDLLGVIRASNVDMVMHMGDFDYNNDPAAWEKLMKDGLGDIPWFAVVGNHDTSKWTEYQQVIQRELDTISGATCVGEVGVKHSCTFKGFKFVLSGVGLMGSGHEDFLRQELGVSTNIWRMCGWHVNQRDLQLGGKGNEAGYGVYQRCQAEGAFVVNGHEHSYGRTLTLTDVGNMGHGATGDWDLINLAQGRTYVIVNGAGGIGLRDYEASNHDDDTWWSSGYASNVTINDGVRTASANIGDAAGVVIMEFGVDGDPRKARGEYRTVKGRIIDEWEIHQDPTGYGTNASGGTGGTGGTSQGWDPQLCAPFCSKCASCQATPGFDEGDCRYQLSSGFDLSDCELGCSEGKTPSFDPATLPSGYQTMDCSEFDSSI
ncbi:MAG: metallophosphoesterase [Polyangiaceae bacterium]